MARSLKEGRETMAHLKFKQIDWDNHGSKLMYVEFDLDGKSVRWYPKWKDLSDIISFSVLTEGGGSSEKYKLFFEAMTMEIVLRSLLRRLPGRKIETDLAISELCRNLKKQALGEE